MRRGESLRDELQRRSAVGAYFTLEEAVAAMVPLIGALADEHDNGVPLFVHASSIRFAPQGCTLDLEAASEMPSLPSDRACLAPEERESPTGSATASVFACGALLYEMLTGEPVGPSMLRPSELAPEIPDAFEVLLGKALITDPNQRPHDLRALAHALHHCAPTSSTPPRSVLDADESLDIDLEVSMSLLPPAIGESRQSLVDLGVARAKAVTHGTPMPNGPAASAAPAPKPAGPKGATGRLAELKARLEADPRPRYVVIKDGMDHGPFSAVELLHQIATRSFAGEHELIDTFTKDERPIADWPEFSPFAEQAHKGVEAQRERKQLEASVSADSDRARVKTFVAAAIAIVGIATLAGLYVRKKAKAEDASQLRMGEAQNVDFDGGVGKSKGGKGPGGRTPGGGNRGPGDGSGDDSAPSESGGTTHPIVPDGLSCEGARAKYIEDYSKDAPPDLTAGAFGAVLNRGDYLNSCAVPPSMSVSICAAVQNGHAVGVTVSTSPPNGGIARCVSGQVRSLSFPAHPRLDVTNTTFAAQ